LSVFSLVNIIDSIILEVMKRKLQKLLLWLSYKFPEKYRKTIWEL